MLELIVFLISLIAIGGTIWFPIVTYREIRDEGLSLYIVCWGIVANSLGLLVWACLFWVWQSILLSGTLPIPHQ